MQFEDEILREVLLTSPHDPAKSWIHETELMARCVDRVYSGKRKVPLTLGPDEGGYHGTGSAVNVDRDRDTGIFLVVVKDLGNRLDGLVVAGVG